MRELFEDLGRTRDLFGGVTGRQKIIEDWINSRIKVAQEILKQTHNATGSLGKLTFENLKLTETQVLADIVTESYWDFINSGVKGVELSQRYTTNQEGNIYSFKTLKPSKSMVQSLMGQGENVTGGGAWMSAKGIPLDKNIAYAIATDIKKHGIKANEYMNIAFNEEALEQLENAIFEEIERIWQ